LNKLKEPQKHYACDSVHIRLRIRAGNPKGQKLTGKLALIRREFKRIFENRDLQVHNRQRTLRPVLFRAYIITLILREYYISAGFKNFLQAAILFYHNLEPFFCQPDKTNYRPFRTKKPLIFVANYGIL